MLVQRAASKKIFYLQKKKIKGLSNYTIAKDLVFIISFQEDIFMDWDN